MILLIDNYDSFTFNIVQYFGKLGQQVVVFRNDKITLAEIKTLKPKYIVISPGPCDPDKAGISTKIIQEFSCHIPILGVCLGHQCIGQVFGGQVIRANQIMHGRVSRIRHTNTGVFTDLKNPMTVTRYHSLVIEKNSLPSCFAVTAWSLPEEIQGDHKLYQNYADCIDMNTVEIMGIKHKTLPLEGVQFHPESIMSEAGLELFANFLHRYQ